MKKICFINGSLRGDKSSSLIFMRDFERRLSAEECQKTFLTVRAKVKGGYPPKTLNGLAEADAIVLVFPLHDYGLPGALMRLLEDYYEYLKAGQTWKRGARVYVILNCAFARAAISGEAVRVVRNFCRRLSLNWRFAICIGTGPVVAVTSRLPFLDLKLRKAYRIMAADIQNDALCEQKDILIKPLIPEWLQMRIKNYYERKGKMVQSK